MAKMSNAVWSRLRNTSQPSSEHPDANLLAALAENALLPRERDAVVAHVAECADCREYMAVACAAREAPGKAGTDPVPAGLPACATADSHLDRLLLVESEIPWYRSLYQNVRELLSPPKLPPLIVTSKPVAVRSIWEVDEHKKTAGLSSLLIHAGVIVLMVVVGTNKKVQEQVKKTVTLIAPDLAPPPEVAQMKPKKNLMGGGGGGGDRSPLPASKGRLPRIASRQFTPPMAVVNNPNPKLIMEPTIIAQIDAPVPNVNMSQYGDPWGKIGPPSNGPGSGGGIGSGSGGGVGSGSGPGAGPGHGGGFGGGVYRIGGGVSAPVPLFRPEPEYSEEARKAKFQGTVLLYVEIDEQGRTRNLKVVRPLGLGLDEKAMEAVSKWRFKPAVKNGAPVAVGATIEVNFRLL